MAAFYFGNITYPSHDPPRMGFLSTVPKDAASQLVSAVAAVQTGDNFPCRFFLPSLFPLLLLTPSLQPYRNRPQAGPSNPPERRLTAYLWLQVQAARRRRGLRLVVPRRDRRAVRSRQGGWGWGWGCLLWLLGCCNCGRDVRGRSRGGGILDLSMPLIN